MNKMSRQKFKYLKKEKAFFIVLKDFHWSTLKQFFLEGEGSNFKTFGIISEFRFNIKRI